MWKLRKIHKKKNSKKKCKIFKGYFKFFDVLILLFFPAGFSFLSFLAVELEIFKILINVQSIGVIFFKNSLMIQRVSFWLKRLPRLSFLPSLFELLRLNLFPSCLSFFSVFSLICSCKDLSFNGLSPKFILFSERFILFSFERA